MYSFESRVRFSECDNNGRMTLLSMINYLQDCSTFHCESLGVGIFDLIRKGLAWALMGWQIRILELPNFDDTIRISTWCYKLNRSFAMRNFLIADAASGRHLVEADSQWLMYDFKLGRAIRVPESQMVYLSHEPPLDMGAHSRKVRLPADGSGAVQCPDVTVEAHNLDVNNHVNNAQYVLFALDAIHDLGYDFSLNALTVQYMQMAFEHDVIVPVVYVGEDGFIVDLKGQADESYCLLDLRGSVKGGIK